jgi:hypothetical protein
MSVVDGWNIGSEMYKGDFMKGMPYFIPSLYAGELTVMSRP